MTSPTIPTPRSAAAGWASDRHRRSVIWIVALSTAAIVFDGYDLVVYGTVLPTLLADSTQLGALSPEQAGALGSYALIGVMVGALTAGAFGDRIGRRRTMLTCIVWFSVGMGPPHWPRTSPLSESFDSSPESESADSSPR